MTKGEHSGGNVNYYVVYIANPKRPEFHAYHAECEDIIEALGMTFAEGCCFKALWRSCAERTLGKVKQGGDAVYDAEKIVYYGNRILAQRKAVNSVQQPTLLAVQEPDVQVAPEVIQPAPIEASKVAQVVSKVPVDTAESHQAAHDLLHGKPIVEYAEVDAQLRQAAIELGRK